MRVELAVLIALRNGPLRELPDACHLRVVKRVHKVRARDRAVRDDARAVSGLRAPRDVGALRVPDRQVRARLRGREDAPVLDRVSCGGSVSDDEVRMLLGYGEAARRTVDVLLPIAPVATDH